MGFALAECLFSLLSFEAKSAICRQNGFCKTLIYFIPETAIDLVLSLPNFSWHPWRSWRWQ
jgi:hypothetical protein